MSPRLPGVSILSPEATGAQYRRWRRNVQMGFTAKGTWGHCDGTSPMPMPERIAPSENTIPTNASETQPSLLEERRAWVKKDRDVKLDIFLSVSDDIKLDVFEVGPPLPPSAMTAKEMLDALDEHFDSFKFEDYHHVFCHFLNLHIDHYTSLEEFNAEFLATVEDLADHGFPLHNAQACSAYFSKLRCTQNPWVAKKIKEWDTLSTPPQLTDLFKEVPPWMIIRPLTYKNPTATPGSYTEELMGSQTDSDVATLSSFSSQEITVHASMEDLKDSYTFPVPGTIPKRLSSKPPPPNPEGNRGSLPGGKNRPLPPLPRKGGPTSAPALAPAPASASAPIQTSTPVPTSPQTGSMKVPNISPQPSSIREPPVQRPSTPNSSTKDTTSVQGSPSLASSINTPPKPIYLPPPVPPPSSPLPSLPFLPSASSPDLHSLLTTFTSNSPPQKSKERLRQQQVPAPITIATPTAPTPISEPLSTSWPQRSPLNRHSSSASSVMSLPLQGVPEKAMGETGVMIPGSAATAGNEVQRPVSANAATAPPQDLGHRANLSAHSDSFLSPNLHSHSTFSSPHLPFTSSKKDSVMGSISGRGSWESNPPSSKGLGLGISEADIVKERQSRESLAMGFKERNSLERLQMSMAERKRSWSIKSMMIGRRLEVKEII